MHTIKSARNETRTETISIQNQQKLKVYTKGLIK